ncbi:hypothetical protein, partial [Acetobacterium wieringae]|uniref:hypothetical protein n=1 Tax=Acetobacterium wieringae TaxID=52694 RepID=UPI001A9A482E
SVDDVYDGSNPSSPTISEIRFQDEIGYACEQSESCIIELTHFIENSSILDEKSFRLKYDP